MSVENFRIDVRQSVLDDLELRLARTRFARFTNDGGWDFGTSTEYMDELVQYWRTQYNWRAQEARLNSLPQFKARVHGNDLHFVHARGQGASPTPLLLLHGWPDSFYRFSKVIPVLSDPAAHGQVAQISFDVVAPSLPGFAFSGRAKFENEERLNRQTAKLIWQLMTETLGYEQFAVAGGDGGSAIAQILAMDYPESIIGIHLTDLGWHATNVDPKTVTRPEQKYLEHSMKAFLADSAYAMVQVTKPRSLAVALNDSPIALASWIVNRFHSWSDHNGNIYDAFSQDEILTNIMIYWVTQTIGSSIFPYYAENKSPSILPHEYVERPVALALFPKDIGGIPPRRLAERTLNVERWTEMPHGGHFAALEVPEPFVNDVSDFFGALKHEPATQEARVG